MIDVKKLAELSRLGLSDRETKKLGKDVEGIVAYISKLQDFNVSESTAAAENDFYPVQDVVRVDENPHQPGLLTKEILNLAPQSEKGFFRVKKIL